MVLDLQHLLYETVRGGAMNRILWAVAAVSLMALCWGTIFLSVGSTAVAMAQESTNTTLCQLDPEYRFSYEPPALFQNLPLNAARKL
jgi:hypothetical protein